MAEDVPAEAFREADSQAADIPADFLQEAVGIVFKIRSLWQKMSHASPVRL